jgi:hypothetical protein
LSARLLTSLPKLGAVFNTIDVLHYNKMPTWAILERYWSDSTWSLPANWYLWLCFDSRTNAAATTSTAD